MEAKVVWKQRMSFDGSSDSGFVIPLGTDQIVGGDNDGFRPLELLLIGLVGCTGMDVISILQKKQLHIDSFEVRVSANRQDEHPRVFSSAEIEYIIRGNDIDISSVERAVTLSETKYCPAQAMLKKAFSISHKITIDNL